MRISCYNMSASKFLLELRIGLLGVYFCDYHIHSGFSFDGHQSIGDICETAIQRGIREIAVTDHYDIDGVIQAYYPPYYAEKAKKEIYETKEKYKGKLIITHGIELGQPHLYKKEAEDFVKKYNFEFIIGSLHNLKGVPDFSFMRYDTMPEELCENLWLRSLDELYDMLSFEYIHTVGHITYPIRYMNRYGKDIDLKKYYDHIIKIYKKIIEKGICLEVNTSGLRQEMNSTLPNKELLCLYKECGGELLTCGSDAHRSEHIGSGISAAYELIKETGFGYIAVYHGGKIEMIKIN